MQKAGLCKLSSASVIPELPRGQKIREVDHFDPYKVAGCYSQSKAMATQLVLDSVRDNGLNACVVHPGVIIGPGDYEINQGTRTLLRILKGKLSIGVAGSFNLCDVRDVAHGCVMAADRGRLGECYILGNEEVTMRRFCELLKDEMRCRGPKLYLPAGVASRVARVMERRAKKTGKEPVLNSFAVYNLARNNDFDSSKARRELGYHTRPYEQTLHDLAVWLKEEQILYAA